MDKVYNNREIKFLFSDLEIDGQKNFKSKAIKRGGFSLIELLVVILILGLLVGLVLQSHWAGYSSSD